MMTSAASAQSRAGTSPFAEGYLSSAELPDSLALLPAPPAEGSLALTRDRAAAEKARAFVGTPRWELATRDAELRMPQAAQAFSCAVGFKLDAASTPKLMTLLARTQGNLAYSGSVAKDHYKRTRPFMDNGLPSCTPEREANQRRDGAYPSGHAAIGWGWALILAELVPSRSAAILARGRAFGDSRIICNVHWLSDTEEGRLLGAATVARFHANTTFRNDLEAARAEVLALSVRAADADPACAAQDAIERFD